MGLRLLDLEVWEFRVQGIDIKGLEYRNLGVGYK